MLRQDLAEPFDRLCRKFGERDLKIARAVGCHHARATAIGQYRQPRTFDAGTRGEGLGGCEQLVYSGDAYRAGALYRSIEDIVATDQCSSV